MKGREKKGRNGKGTHSGLDPVPLLFLQIYAHNYVRVKMKRGTRLKSHCSAAQWVCVGPGDSWADVHGHDDLREALQVRSVSVNAALHGNERYKYK